MTAVHEDPDRRVEQARESLLARVSELGRRFQSARNKLDLKAKIAAHPRAAVAIAFAVGAVAGIGGKRTKPSVPATGAEATRGLLGALVATLGSLAFTLAKNVAMHQLSRNASAWWDRRQEMESNASYTRDTEAFLEH